VLDLPMNRPTKDGVKEIFKHFGDLHRIMIIRPGNPVPDDVKPYLDCLRLNFDTEYAFVEFEDDTEAIKAVDFLNTHNLNNLNTKVFLLGDVTPDTKLLQKT